MLEKYCDILVIGTELPGLITAAFLARRGLSVQVIESDFYANHPQMPDPTCLTGVHSKLLRSILGRLNVPEVTIQNFLALESNLQVIFPKHRVDVCGNPLLYADEIEREFPSEESCIKTFYEDLARERHQIDVNDLFQQLLPYTWRERRAFKKFLKQSKLHDKSAVYKNILAKNSVLKSYFKAQYILGYQSFCDDPFAFQVAEMFNPGDGEIFGIISGLKPLRDILLDRLTHHDGHIRHKISAQKLLYRNGIFEGVELSGTGDTVLAKYIIWNSSLAKLRELLPKKWRYRSLRKSCDAFQSHFQWFTVRFEIAKNLIPEPMKRNVVLIDEAGKELSGTNFLYVQIRDTEEDATSLIDVNFLLPRSALGENNEFFKPHFDGIRAKLLNVLPFSEKHLRQVFPLENAEKVEDTLFPMSENDFEVFRHAAETFGVGQQDEKSFQNLFPLNYRTPTPNFFVTHPKVFNAFALESKLMLGLKITDIIWQEAEKEKKRAMKSERRIA